MAKEKKKLPIKPCVSKSSSTNLVVPSGSSTGIGEELPPCTDSEWNTSESAYSADLLNVKKNKNRVTVFAAPEKFADQPSKSEKSNSNTEEVDERAGKLSHLISRIVKILRENPEKTNGVEVTVSMKIGSGEKRTLNFY